MPKTLGELVSLLKTCDPEARVLINGHAPVSIESYRGYYKDAAITVGGVAEQPEVPTLDDPGKPFEMNMAGYGTYTPGHSEMLFPKNPTVEQVIAGIELCYGEEFEGYKGGQFLFDSHTDVWQSEWSQCSQLGVVGIEDAVDVVRINVEKEGW